MGRGDPALRPAPALAALLAAILTGCGAQPAPRAPAHPSPSARAPAPSPPAPSTGCVARPSACGFPDASDTGVGAGAALRPAGPIVIRRRGAVISGLDVSGTIQVLADDVRIVHSRVVAAYPSGAAVFIAPNVSGTVIEDSTIAGRDRSTGAVAYAVLNAGWPGNATTVLRRVRMYNCSECYNGPGTVVDSFASASADVPGAHYEAVFYGGGSRLTLRHDTLLNPHPQTAVVYTEPDAGPVSHVAVTGSLLAGGGWTIYGGGHATTDFKVSDNLFSAHFYRKVGHFGLSTAINPSQTTWDRNRFQRR